MMCCIQGGGSTQVAYQHNRFLQEEQRTNSSYTKMPLQKIEKKKSVLQSEDQANGDGKKRSAAGRADVDEESLGSSEASATQSKEQREKAETREQ